MLKAGILCKKLVYYVSYILNDGSLRHLPVLLIESNQHIPPADQRFLLWRNWTDQRKDLHTLTSEGPSVVIRLLITIPSHPIAKLSGQQSLSLHPELPQNFFMTQS